MGARVDDVIEDKMLLEIVLLLVAGAAFVYFRFQYKTTYWANMGVRQPEKTPFINGNNCASAPEVASKKVHLNDISVAQYREFRDVPFYGTYAFGVTPYRVLTVTDLDLIKNIYGAYSKPRSPKTFRLNVYIQ